jgi:hypothetical protein
MRSWPQMTWLGVSPNPNFAVPHRARAPSRRSHRRPSVVRGRDVERDRGTSVVPWTGNRVATDHPVPTAKRSGANRPKLARTGRYAPRTATIHKRRGVLVMKASAVRIRSTALPPSPGMIGPRRASCLAPLLSRDCSTRSQRSPANAHVVTRAGGLIGADAAISTRTWLEARPVGLRTESQPRRDARDHARRARCFARPSGRPART